jgi:fumarate reductase subunit D
MARSNEPFWWALFSAGMMIGALVVPALVLITGVLPLNPDRLYSLLNHPLVRLLLFVVISLSFFHWAHRFRFTLVDLGLKEASSVIAIACYGSAIVGTVLAGLIALHVV